MVLGLLIGLQKGPEYLAVRAIHEQRGGRRIYGYGWCRLRLQAQDSWRLQIVIYFAMPCYIYVGSAPRRRRDMQR